jgi:hypothetical protein
MLVLAGFASASDSLRTVREFRYRVFGDLNMADTVNGNAALDSTKALRFISEGAADVGSKVGVEKAKSVTLVANTNAYLLDAHLSGIRAAAVVKNYQFYPVNVVSFEDFNNSLLFSSSTTDSVPKFCAAHGDSIYFHPVPSYAGTVKVWYWARGKVLMTQADTCDLPYELYPAVEYFAASRAAGVFHDPVAEKRFYDRYLNEITFYRALYGRDVKK